LFTSPDYREGACSLITPASESYGITVKVLDRVTGLPIANADVSVDVLHVTYTYLGTNKCKLSPPIFNHGISEKKTNAEGIATFSTLPLNYQVDIDHTSVEISATAPNYNQVNIAKKLFKGSPSVYHECKLIDLTTEP
jgi:hypothetical protein